MERTTKQERKHNALLFWQYLTNGYCKNRVAIVIERQDSKTNPNIHRVQFITSRVNSSTHNIVIAESTDGAAGCFYELIRNIRGDIEQKNYFENDFNKWLRKTCHMEIIYNDGLVIILEYKK